MAWCESNQSLFHGRSSIPDVASIRDDVAMVMATCTRRGSIGDDVADRTPDTRSSTRTIYTEVAPVNASFHLTHTHTWASYERLTTTDRSISTAHAHVACTSRRSVRPRAAVTSDCSRPAILYRSTLAPRKPPLHNAHALPERSPGRKLKLISVCVGGVANQSLLTRRRTPGITRIDRNRLDCTYTDGRGSNVWL